MFVLLAQWPLFALATDADQITIGIGYADIHDSPIIDSTRPTYKFSPTLGPATLELLQVTARNHGFAEIDPNPLLTTLRKGNLTIKIIQPNHLCPDEATSGLIYRAYGRECSEQKVRSERAMDLFANEAARSSAVLFIGHARGGDGFAFGSVRHFRARLNFPEFLRGFTRPGQLQALFLGMCKSSTYYLPELRANPLFASTRTFTYATDPDWWREVAPRAMRYLNILLTNRNLLKDLPQDIQH